MDQAILDQMNAQSLVLAQVSAQRLQRPLLDRALSQFGFFWAGGDPVRRCHWPWAGPEYPSSFGLTTPCYTHDDDIHNDVVLLP